VLGNFARGYRWRAALADALAREVLLRKEITTEKRNAEPEGTVVGKTFLTFLTPSPAIKCTSGNRCAEDEIAQASGLTILWR